MCAVDEMHIIDKMCAVDKIGELPTSTQDVPKKGFWIAYADTATFYQQHTFYHKTIYRFMKF